MCASKIVTSLIAVICAVHAPAFSQALRPEYGIKFDNPQPGSFIRREAVRGSKIPINKKYADLTAEEREIVRGWYENVGVSDEPPFPSDGLKPVLDKFRKIQEALLVEGELYLVATVSPTGQVTEVKAFGSPSADMVKFASAVVLLTQFKPGVCAGIPCQMDFPFNQRFSTEQ